MNQPRTCQTANKDREIDGKLQTYQHICSDLALRMLEPYGCTCFTATWNSTQTLLPIKSDERGGPFAADSDGNEQCDVMLSITDENGHLLHLWAFPEAGSPLIGMGVDLASTREFTQTPSNQRFIKRLFTEHEHELVTKLWADDSDLGYASVFAAREAAFKATAQPLRAWYRKHTEELHFGAMHFSLATPQTVVGDQRGGGAQEAMEKMGIGRIEVGFARLDDMALAIAVALTCSNNV